MRVLSVTALSLLAAGRDGAASTETPGSGVAIGRLPNLPPGTTLPVQLSQTLHAARVAPGLLIHASTTQRTPLGGHAYLPAGVVLDGRIVAAGPHSLALQFDSIRFLETTRPVATHALAIASFVAVSETGVPANGSTDRGNSSPASWTTTQVGGDQVVRSGWSGPVINSVTETVGSADYWGVYALPVTPDAPAHALGPFSARSTGLFGFARDCHLSHPQTDISCVTTRPVLHRGDVLLLEVE